MTTKLSNQTLRACVLLSVWVTVCCGALAAYFQGTAYGAEREICDNMTGEQLRRCIEDASRAQSAPANTGAPARASTPNASAIILPPTPGKAAEPASSRILNCTKVSFTDQSFCAFRNSALLECANRGKYPDPDRCFNDVMSRAPDLVAVDCSKLPAAHQATCQQRNKVYALCKNDKMNYLACLETKMAKR